MRGRPERRLSSAQAATRFVQIGPRITVSQALLFTVETEAKSAKEEQIEPTRSEPCVYAQTIAGKDAPCFGEAKNSWLAGTAGPSARWSRARAIGRNPRTPSGWRSRATFDSSGT
jgi:hypothetical protein